MTWLLKLLGLYEAPKKHPCQEAFRMPDMTPLGVDLLGLHMRNTHRSFGSWGR